MHKVGLSRLADLMVMGFFQRKSEYTKVSYRYLKNFYQKEWQKNFDYLESWKIEFHCRHQNYISFQSACSTEFKTDRVENRLYSSRETLSQKSNISKKWRFFENFFMQISIYQFCIVIFKRLKCWFLKKIIETNLPNCIFISFKNTIPQFLNLIWCL